MNDMDKLLARMELGEALAAVAAAARRLLSQVSEQGRADFVVSLIGDGGADKLSSMVSL